MCWRNEMLMNIENFLSLDMGFFNSAWIFKKKLKKFMPFQMTLSLENSG